MGDGRVGQSLKGETGKVIQMSILPLSIHSTKHKVSQTPEQMFTAALFILAKNEEQPKCPSAGERINKMWWKIIQPQKGMKY